MQRDFSSAHLYKFLKKGGPKNLQTWVHPTKISPGNWYVPVNDDTTQRIFLWDQQYLQLLALRVQAALQWPLWVIRWCGSNSVVGVANLAMTARHDEGPTPLGELPTSRCLPGTFQLLGKLERTEKKDWKNKQTETIETNLQNKSAAVSKFKELLFLLNQPAFTNTAA